MHNNCLLTRTKAYFQEKEEKVGKFLNYDSILTKCVSVSVIITIETMFALHKVKFEQKIIKKDDLK